MAPWQPYQKLSDYADAIPRLDESLNLHVRKAYMLPGCLPRALIEVRSRIPAKAF